MNEENEISPEVRQWMKQLEEDCKRLGHELDEWQWREWSRRFASKCKNPECKAKAVIILPSHSGKKVFGHIIFEGIEDHNCPNF